MIEAAIVMPLVLLMSFAVIYFSIFQFENFNLQVRNHQELLAAADASSGGAIHTKEITKYNSIDLGGIMENILEKDICDSKYVVNIPFAIKTLNVF